MQKAKVDVSHDSRVPLPPCPCSTSVAKCFVKRSVATAITSNFSPSLSSGGLQAPVDWASRVHGFAHCDGFSSGVSRGHRSLASRTRRGIFRRIISANSVVACSAL